MTDALRYEWVRITSIRSTWWLSGLTVLCGVGITFLVAWGISQALSFEPAPTAAEVERMGVQAVTHFANAGAPYLVPYVVGIIGVLAWGHEYRHGMIRATLTALPSRPRAWAAKYVVVGAWVAGVTFLTLLGSMAATWVWLGRHGVPIVTGDMWLVVGKAVTFTVLFTLLVAAIASLVRHQTVTLVLMFLWPLVVEGAVSLILSLLPGTSDIAPVTRFLPFQAGTAILGDGRFSTSLFGTPLAPLGGLIVFTGYLVALLVASAVLFQRRDA